MQKALNCFFIQKHNVHYTGSTSIQIVEQGSLQVTSLMSRFERINYIGSIQDIPGNHVRFKV